MLPFVLSPFLDIFIPFVLLSRSKLQLQINLEKRKGWTSDVFCWETTIEKWNVGRFSLYIMCQAEFIYSTKLYIHCLRRVSWIISGRTRRTKEWVATNWTQTNKTNSYPILLQEREKPLTYASNKLPSSQFFFFFQTAYLAVFLTSTLLLIVPILELQVLYNLLLPLAGPEQVNKKSSMKERTCQDRRTNEVKSSRISSLTQTERIP